MPLPQSSVTTLAREGAPIAGVDEWTVVVASPTLHLNTLKRLPALPILGGPGPTLVRESPLSLSNN